MADTFSRAKRSKIMAAVRSRGNKATEIRFVRILRGQKIAGWRRGSRLCGKPDFVFLRSKLAVFVDGCFWHGCKRHLRVPATNREYWLRKIQRNVTRDKATVRVLRKAGWNVLRIWEHELNTPSRVTSRLTKALKRRRD
ncbi:MAG: very short patch repair endonuclease [Verrucomicrobiota bacterium]